MPDKMKNMQLSYYKLGVVLLSLKLLLIIWNV